MPHSFCSAQQGVTIPVLQLLLPCDFLLQGSLQGEETDLLCVPDDSRTRSAIPMTVLNAWTKITLSCVLRFVTDSSSLGLHVVVQLIACAGTLPQVLGASAFCVSCNNFV